MTTYQVDLTVTAIPAGSAHLLPVVAGGKKLDSL